MVEHSKLMGGSIAERRMNCPGSFNLEEQAPIPASSAFADEGTMLHSVMETVLSGTEPAELIGYEELGHTLTQDLVDEMVAPALVAYDLLQEAYGEISYVTEAKVELPGTDAFGYCDILGQTTTHNILLDWKFGRGVPVQGGPDNYQLKFYAAAAMQTPLYQDMIDPEKSWALAVVQPAMDYPLSHGIIGPQALGAFTDDVMWAMDRIQSGVEDLSTGSWCRFCRAAAICPEKRGLVEGLARIVPTDPRISPVELGRLLEMAEQAEAWVRAVRTTAHSELEKGRDAVGWKLVPKRATRKWVDDTRAKAFLRSAGLKVSEITETKLYSPAKAEKALKSKGVKRILGLEQLTVSRSSGTSLVRASDKRPAITNRRDGSFLNLPAQPNEGRKKS